MSDLPPTPYLPACDQEAIAANGYLRMLGTVAGSLADLVGIEAARYLTELCLSDAYWKALEKVSNNPELAIQLVQKEAETFASLTAEPPAVQEEDPNADIADIIRKEFE